MLESGNDPSLRKVLKTSLNLLGMLWDISAGLEILLRFILINSFLFKLLWLLAVCDADLEVHILLTE